MKLIYLNKFLLKRYLKFKFVNIIKTEKFYFIKKIRCDIVFIGLNNIKNNLYKIMDLINLDRSLLEIELMDTTNDVDYAKQVYKKINGF